MAPEVSFHTKQHRTWFTTVDMANVLRAAYPHPRDYALLFFMQATAMRVGEVLPLNADSIHRDPGRAWVGFVGKGAKYAEITLDYPTLTGLDRYLAGRVDGPLFVNEWGVTGSPARTCRPSSPASPTTYIGLDSGRGALTRQRVSSVYAQMSG